MHTNVSINFFFNKGRQEDRSYRKTQSETLVENSLLELGKMWSEENETQIEELYRKEPKHKLTTHKFGNGEVS